MPLFGAFVRARVCWCSVRPGGSDRAGGCGVLSGAHGQRGGKGWTRRAASSRPLSAGRRRAGPRAPRGADGWGSLRFVCDSGGAWALSLLPGGAAVLGKGRGQLGQPRALVPGCCRGDNRGRGSPIASLTPTPVVAPLGSPLSEGAGRRLLAAAPLGPDCATRGLHPLPALLFAQ